MTSRRRRENIETEISDLDFSATLALWTFTVLSAWMDWSGGTIFQNRQLDWQEGSI